MTDSRTDGTLATRYAALQQRLRAASAASPAASPRPPVLVGVAKGQSGPILGEALAAGLREFGENRVQEAAEKWPALKAQYPDIVLHLIGPLQSNKAADAVALFDVIHTIDRAKIAANIAHEMKKQNKSPRLLIQVNIGEEPQKAGVDPRDVGTLFAYCRSLGLTIEGLMCVPPVADNPAPYFALLHKMAKELGLNELSMGMSADFETAVRLGATMVRVGTALFGERI